MSDLSHDSGLRDLSAAVGFNLIFDPVALTMHSGDGFTFARTTRQAGALRNVLRAPEALSPETPLYHIFYLDNAPPAARDLLAAHRLTYSPVLLPPHVIGGEFVKTSGHYHPSMPGSALSYPEVYTGLLGELYLFLQRRDPAQPGAPLDCVLARLVPGVTITIPPDYAHVLINPTGEMALMAGLYGTEFKPDYGEVEQHHGLAYYILQGEGGQIEIERNPHYTAAPPLNWLETVTGTIFTPPDNPAIPLWRSFVAAPERYAFLTRPEAAAARFEA